MNRDSLLRNRTRARRVVIAAIAAVAPTALLAWSGCSSSSTSSGAGPIAVDPGGTYGAEITVTVVGRGRITTDIPGLDCPGDCFTSLVFDSATADGASGGVKLKASTTSPNTRFAGWKFDPAPLGARGKGPPSCNPIQRAAATPSVDMNADEITLPFGQTDGTAPAGQECTGFTSVPLAYDVTATFVDTTIRDAGADGDGGPGEILYQAANGGGAAQEIGVVDGRLYWKFQSGAFFGLATGTTSATPGATPQTLVAPPAQSITRLEVDAHVVVQKQNGELSVYANGSTFPTVLSGAPFTCSAVTSDSQYVYCQSGSTLYQWTVGGTGPTTLYTGLPTGADRFVSDNGSYFYFVDNSGGAGASIIERTPSNGDGGAATFTPLITGQTTPIRLRANGSRMFWINYQSAQIRGEGHTAFLGSTTSTIDVADTSGLRFLALDPSSSSTAWFGAVPVDDAVNSVIVKASTSGNGTMFLSGINGLGGVAVDSSYVYWTASDGTVRRMSKF